MYPSLEVYNIFLRTFSAFGLAPFAIDTKNTAKGKIITKIAVKRLLSKLVPVTVMLISLGQFSLILTIANGTLDGEVHETLFYGYFFLIILSNIAGNIQCLVYSSEYLDIIRRINNIERLLIMKFHIQINFKECHKILKRKFSIIFSILISATLINYWSYGWNFSRDVLLRSIVTILELISSLVSLHPVLYVDVVNMFILELNQTLTKSEGHFQASAGSAGICKDLKNLKFIHFEVWYLTQKINKYFGWSFVFLIIKYFIDALYLLYWIFIEIVELGWNSLTHVGKSANTELSLFNTPIKIYVLESTFSLIHSLLCLIILTSTCHHCLSNVIVYSSK